MKATIKNQIRLAIVAVCVVLFIAPSAVIAEETLLLASLTRITPLEDYHHDPFMDIRKEARKEADEKELKVKIDIIEDIQKAEDVHKEQKADTVDKVVTSAAWAGDKALSAYQVLNGDYTKPFFGFLSD